MFIRRLAGSFEKRSIRTKVTLGVVLPLLVILGLLTAIEYSRQRAALLSNLSLLSSNAAELIEDNLRHDMLESDFEGVQRHLDSVGRNDSFSVLYLMNISGEIIFAPEGRGVGSRLDNEAPDCLPCHTLPVEERPNSIVVENANGQRVFRSMQPIENEESCTECHDPRQPLIGMLLTDVPVSTLETPLSAFLRENLLWWVGTIFITVLVVNLVLSRFVLNRLERLTSAISQFGRDNYRPMLPEYQPDEIGQLSKAFDDMVDEVITREKENRALSEHLQHQSAQRGHLLERLITAQEDERKRVARELHDDLGQVLSGLALRLEALERFFDTDRELALQQLKDTKLLVSDGTNRMYDLILALRPSALDDLGLVAAFRNHAERSLDGTGIELVFSASKMNGRLPEEMETSLYRVYQEALNNVIRHSGASTIWISMACQQQEFAGEIEDNGRGFDLESATSRISDSRGIGLLGMEERVSQCGGRLEITSSQSGGTIISISIPIVTGNHEQPDTSSDS